VTFDWIVAAQQASYKPSHRNFELAFGRIGGPRERPPRRASRRPRAGEELGLQSVWINAGPVARGQGRPAAAAAPDATLPDMASFAESALRA
jgi:hypothetical protein